MLDELLSPRTADLTRRRRAMVAATSAWALLAVVLLAGRSRSTPSPDGNPDPGHRLLDALRPVAAVMPGGATVSRRTFSEPRWDSCDGIKSTYGWDDVTVDVGFVPHGVSNVEVVDHIKAGLRAEGWTFDARSSSDGAWYWSRHFSQGGHTSIQLLAGGGVNGPEWDLQATTPPATHPVKGC